MDTSQTPPLVQTGSVHTINWIKVVIGVVGLAIFGGICAYVGYEIPVIQNYTPSLNNTKNPTKTLPTTTPTTLSQCYPQSSYLLGSPALPVTQCSAKLIGPHDPNSKIGIGLGLEGDNTPSNVQNIKNWLLSEGISIDYVYPNGILIGISGTTSQMEKLFKVSINDYELDNVHGYASKPVIIYSNDIAPTIPSNLHITGIIDLNNYQEQVYPFRS